jgi:fructose-bisphosphate aldolase, class II
MLQTTSRLLAHAKNHGYAVGAFNTNNLEYIQAILETAEEAQSPVIIQAAGSEIDYMGGFVFTDIVRRITERMSVPVAINLDHGESYDRSVQCIQYGFTSVMFDGSRLSFEDNIAVTREVVKAAHAAGISVEGEIGIIGGTAEIEDMRDHSQELSDPEECRYFVEQTGVDCLAASIGTAHGLYKAAPRLDFERLKTIAELTRVPLVLHGGTGVPAADIKQAISLGVAKINFSTVVRQACISQMKATLAEDPDNLDLMSILGRSKASMKKVLIEMMTMCGSVQKAVNWQ